MTGKLMVREPSLQGLWFLCDGADYHSIARISNATVRGRPLRESRP